MGGRGGAGGGRSDTVTLYHRTQRSEDAQAITREGFRPRFAPGTNPDYVRANSQYAFFSRRPNAQLGYGNHVVEVRVSRKFVERDPWSGQVRVKLTNLPPPSTYQTYSGTRRPRRKKK